MSIPASTLPTVHTTLDLRVGDVVATSYTTGPYVIDRITPQPRSTNVRTMWGDVVRLYPAWSLALHAADDPHGRSSSFINGVYRLDDGWHLESRGDDRLERRDSAPAAGQLTMFATIDETPECPIYVPTADVDYAAGPYLVWHCRWCGVDFNGRPERRHGPAWHTCGYPGQPITLVSHPALYASTLRFDWTHEQWVAHVDAILTGGTP